MIPTFLHSLATQVRALVASGKALHVTNQTADELELLAGLCTQPVRYQLPSPSAGDGSAFFDVYLEAEVTPADIAWAWLKLSQAQCGRFIYDHGGPGEHLASKGSVVRAAEYAELAAIAAALPPRVRNILSSNTVFGPLPMTEPVPQRPHDGTREGARAAWGHVANEIFEHVGSIASEIKGHPAATGDIEFVKRVHDCYRRELEAI